MVGILIIGSIRLYREGLADLLGKQEGFAIAGVSAAPNEHLDLSQLPAADVILLDMASAESFACARRLRASHPFIPIVAIGIADDDREVLACAEIGAAAYVTREDSTSELTAAIWSAARGELCCSPRLAGTLVRRLAVLASQQAPEVATDRLTPRESEVAALLQQALSNKEIAAKLRIEVATVKNHVHHVLDKLKTRSRLEASRLLTQTDRTARLAPTR